MRPLTREAIIRRAIAEKRDPHTATAAVAFNKPESKVTPSEREGQKMWNYTVLYSNRAPLLFPLPTPEVKP